MPMENVQDTAPVEVYPVPEKKKRKIWLWVLLGILLVLVLGGLGALSGYRTALADRVDYHSTQVMVEAARQFNLAEADLQAGRLEIARKRYEQVIQLDPNFPGVAERLKQVILALSVTNTPTPNPTPTLTPTPDLRGAETLFNQARQQMTDENWQGALESLEALRKEDLTYRTIDVDGMYFMALRNRGMLLIAEGSLERGLYDLSLAERFGYLDGSALGLQVVTRLYLTGASFWEIDWAQAAYYFGEIYPLYPSLRDHSGQTARQRYRFATLKYGDQLVAAGDACGALPHYETILALGEDPTVEPTLQQAREICAGPQVTEPPAPEATVTPAPTDPNTVVNPTLEVIESPAPTSEPPAATIQPLAPTSELPPAESTPAP